MSNQQLSAPQIFARDKYLVIKQFLAPMVATLVHRYMVMKAENDMLTTDDSDVPNAPSLYADPLLESLMELMLPQVQQLTGKRLFPTYSYIRVYRNGHQLRPHIDRPACEISFSICLGGDKTRDPNQLWPLYIDNSRDWRQHLDEANGPVSPGQGLAVRLQPGDCMIYRGCEVKHWREPFTGDHQVQAFIHYVDQDGPYAKYRFDTRPRLGAPAGTVTDDGNFKY